MGISTVTASRIYKVIVTFFVQVICAFIIHTEVFIYYNNVYHVEILSMVASLLRLWR